MCLRVCGYVKVCLCVCADVYTSITYTYAYLHTLMRVVYVSIARSSPERSLEYEAFKVA